MKPHSLCRKELAKVSNIPKTVREIHQPIGVAFDLDGSNAKGKRKHGNSVQSIWFEATANVIIIQANNNF